MNEHPMMHSSSPFPILRSDDAEDSNAASSNGQSCDTAPTSYSDDLEALNAIEHESKREKAASVVQHRSWKVSEVFHSEPREAQNSSPIQMANMTSSPPTSPSPIKKRKFGTLNLGSSTLTHPAKAQKVFYGINIHQLLDDAKTEASISKAAKTIEQIPTPPAEPATRSKRANLLWTEKYRARKFTDLIGDERTHRHVMHWLKRWDQIVFPGSCRPKAKKGAFVEEERPHRKILMLAGPPGLGKTTLAHVCARQAGYEVQEINASDERSATVVKGRIRDMVGTENVKNVDNKTAEGKVKKAARPVCVIVDEVDGVVGGSGGGGEGGFVKALIDLIMLDQKNTPLGSMSQAPAKKKGKGERFRLLRPLILICNDVYHPSLRPLRQSSVAEVIHVRKPPVQSLVARLQQVFEREGVPCDSDGVRRLCEAAWGVSNRKEDRKAAGAGEGDMRGIMVVGEWVAGKLRASNNGNERLTRKWVEDNVLSDLAHGGGGARGLGRGGPKDIVERVFQEGAGFPKTAPMSTPIQIAGNDGVKGVAEGVRRTATSRLRELVDTLGDTDRIITDCFSAYPERPFQDDTMLSKPDSAYEWLNFHDRLSAAVHTSNEWELAPYLSTSVLAFHHLFASPTGVQYQAPATMADADTEDSSATHPFSGPTASWTAHEAQKSNESHLQTLQSNLSLPLLRSFRSHTDIATDLQPYLLRMLNPSVNPIVVGGSGKDKGTASVRKASEQTLIKRAVNAMGASGVRFERVRLDGGLEEKRFGAANEWVYRMEPPIDTLCTFETGGKEFGGVKTRYAVRQVLEQEWKKEEVRLAEEARLARFGVANSTAEVVAAPAGMKRKLEDVDAGGKKIVRDFFGRPVVVPVNGEETDTQRKRRIEAEKKEKGLGVWVTFHEGFSNAVRKPITLKEFMQGL